ncbi:SipW-dependent-type signal peptide-containing protein [Pseudarthrobacter sp. NPDC089323]
MTAVAESPQESEQHPRKAPKIRAVLAGGLVLGIGAAVTLAAWNDSEFAQGTFTAGTFNLEGSTDGTAYSSNADPASPKQLAFTTSTANMSPGDVVSAPFAVRLDAASSYDATVTVSTEATSGPLTGLTYTLTRTTGFGCGSGDLSTLVSTNPLGTTPANVTFPLSQGPQEDPGGPVYLCFQVTAGATLPQGSTSTATWEFTAQSL